MLTNAKNRQVLLCLLLCAASVTAVARVDNNWSYRRSKVLVPQTHRSYPGFRPANVSSQTQWQPNNLTNGFNPQPNNPRHFNQTAFRSALYNPQQPKYGQAGLNQTRPVWQQPQPQNRPYPAYGQQGIFNQTRPLRPQPLTPNVSNYPQYPSIGQYVNFNQTRPAWNQPSAPQLPNYPAQPNNLNSWSSSANRTNLYPKLPNGNSGVPQGPHNWHSNGPAILSYGPGQ